MKKYVVVGPDTKIARLGGQLPRAVLILLIVHVGIFMMYAFADGPAWVKHHFAASAEQCLGNLKLWQPVSAFWIHIGTRGLLLNMLALWIFGSPLERWWGSRRFVMFWIVTGVLGLLVGVFFGLLQPTTLLAGAAGAAIATVVAISFIFSNHLIYFYGLLNIKAKHLSLILVPFLILGCIIAGTYIELVVQIGGAIAALIFLLRPRRKIVDMQVKHAKRKFQVINGGKKDEKRYLN